MSDADLFNEWLSRTVPEIRRTLPDATFTARYDDNEHVYDVSVHTADYDDIVLSIVRSAVYFNVSRAFVMVGRDIETKLPVLEPIRGAQHMALSEVLTIARKLQEEYRAE